MEMYLYNQKILISTHTSWDVAFDMKGIKKNKLYSLKDDKWKDQSFAHAHAKFYLPGMIISKAIARPVK